MLSLLQISSLPAGDGPDLTRYLLVCGGLVAGIVVLGVALRHVMGGKLRNRAKARSLEILDVLQLSNRQKLCVVRCYDRSFLVGVGEKELLTVAELDTEEVLAPSPDPLVAAQGRNLGRSASTLVRPSVGLEDAPVVRPLARPEYATQAAPRPAAKQAAPFRDLLANEGVSKSPKTLNRGGVVA